MKLGSFSNVVQSLYAVRSKPESGDGRNSRREQRQGGQDTSGEQGEDAKEFTPEMIDQAVESFSKDSQGLHAQVSGQGLGLKVTLTDGSGAVVRQLTGEEFVRLREAAGTDTRARGKILDQKL